MGLLEQLNLQPPANEGGDAQAEADAISAEKTLMQQVKQAWDEIKKSSPKVGAAIQEAVKTAGEGRKKAMALPDAAERVERLQAASQRLKLDLEAARTLDDPDPETADASLGDEALGDDAQTTRPSPTAKSPAKKPVVVMDMEPEVITVPVSRGLPGDTGEQQIKDLLQGMRDDVQDYWNTYSRGLESFQTSMSFSSEQEAESQYLQVALKSVAKKALEMALDEAGKKLGGPWGVIISTAKGVAEAWAAEAERVQAAQGQVKVRDYIISIRNGISAQQKAMTAVVESGKQTMIEEFRRLAASDYGKGQASPDGVVVGQAAGLVNSLRDAAKAFKAKMPSESYFQQQFTRNFADTPGWSDLISHGAVPTGRIYFGISVYVDPTEDEARPTWKVEDKDEAWKLVTKAPNPDRVADSLKLSLDGKKPWEVDLPKAVKLSLEIEESGLNGYQEGWVHFTSSPDQYQITSNYDLKWFDRAWKQPQIRATALNNVKLTGGSDY